jgi:predicted DNA-binding transcriptional regulator YafY
VSAHIVASVRASRLLSILLLLQTRGRLTARQLADILEVSVRTIYRDVGSLHEAGVPLYGDAGPDGGYQLLGGYRTRLTGLTADEAETLFLAGMPGQAAELGLGTVLATAQLKLHAALPAELREGSARIQERFHLDAPGWHYDGDAVPYLAAVADAVWRQRRIEVRYRRWAAPTDVTRILEPHGIVLKAGQWYIVARADRGAAPPDRRAEAGPDGAFRCYRVSQILGLTALDEPFDRSEGFGLAAFWARNVTEFRARLYQGEATIRLNPAGRRRLRELMSAAVIQSADDTASAPDPGGWITAVVPVESMEHAESDFLRLGANVEVLAPAALRGRLARAAHGMAGLYPPD